MGEEKKPSLADIYWLGNNLQYCRLKAQQPSLMTKQQFKVRANKGDGSLIEALELKNITLKDYNMTSQVQKDIQKWIEYLNKSYSQMPENPSVLDFLNPAVLKYNDANALVRDIEHWRKAICSSLENDFYVPYQINTALIDKSKLISGISSFLNEDILKHLSDDTKSDLNDAIKCILYYLPTPAAMITFRASEDVLRMYYEKKTQKSSAGKMWYMIIKELLSSKGINKNLVNYLDYIRDKRNEAEHPGKVFTQYESEQAFMQVMNLITEVSKELNS